MNILSLLTTIIILLTLACGSVGKQFDNSQVKNIKQGSTKKSEVLEMLGLPFKEGQQDGKSTWEYQYNQYSAINEGRYEDLVILFNEIGVVESYRYTSSIPDIEN